MHTVESINVVLDEILADVGDNYGYKDRDDTWYAGKICNYFSVEDGTPMCIVGEVLDRLDYEPHPDMEGTGATTYIYETARNDFTSDSMVFLRRVQRYQDQGKTWRVAVDAVRAEVLDNPQPLV